MIISQFITNAGVPTTSLTAEITIYEEGVVIPVVNAQALSEYGDGLYYYNFSTYNQRKRYVIYIDGDTGGLTLTGTDRHKFQELAYMTFFEYQLSMNDEKLKNGNQRYFLWSCKR